MILNATQLAEQVEAIFARRLIFSARCELIELLTGIARELGYIGEHSRLWVVTEDQARKIIAIAKRCAGFRRRSPIEAKL